MKSLFLSLFFCLFSAGVLSANAFQFKSSHILVNDQKEATLIYTEIQAIPDSLPNLKLTKFREFATRYSKDPGTAKVGGELGWAEKGTFVPEYDKVVEGLKIGEVSTPFRTTFGWHLMFLEDIRRTEQTTNSQNTESQKLRISTESTNFQRRIALVIGNANYKVRPLKNPRNDADDVSRSLKATGFEVIDLRDATLPKMRSAVRQFGDRLVNNDVGLVYYSGHGVEVKGRNYFIPVNADIQREDEIADQGLDVSLILEKMSTAGKGVNILIVDACRDDPFGRSFRSSSRGLANMDAPRGTIIAYATSPGKVASDGDPRERNSPYTKHLVKAMQSPNKPIEQVFKEVRRAVQDETKNQQTPWENTSLSGDFFFRVQR
jgi:hypothetical protein